MMDVCAFHENRQSFAECAKCGCGLCGECQHSYQDKIYCDNCRPDNKKPPQKKIPAPAAPPEKNDSNDIPPSPPVPAPQKNIKRSLVILLGILICAAVAAGITFFLSARSGMNLAAGLGQETPQQHLYTMAQGIERFQQDTGHYPSREAELFEADRAYWDEAFRETAWNNYIISRIFMSDGYIITATPSDPDKANLPVYRVETGGVVIEKKTDR